MRLLTDNKNCYIENISMIFLEYQLRRPMFELKKEKLLMSQEVWAWVRRATSFLKEELY